LPQLTHFTAPTPVLSIVRADGSESHPLPRTKLRDSAPDWG
jgi:hypothetical protein